MKSSSDLDLSAVLARRIKAARALSGKKARELADELGWSTEKLYRFERGGQVPDALELAAVASATGQPMVFFFEAPPVGSSDRLTLPAPLPVVNLEDQGAAVS